MPRKQKLDSEEKVALVQRCIAGELGLSEAGREAGVDRTSVRHWIARYEAEGSDGFQPRKHVRMYAPELKLQVVEEYLSGTQSILDLCKKYKISDTHVVREWIKKYNAHEDFHSVKHSGGKRMFN